MILFPNAKINLGLQIVERRRDGFHTIETLFIPIGLSDILELIESGSRKTTLCVTGFEPDSSPENNLVMKAWEIMHHKYNVPHVEIHLHKSIPFGAGLGGGSSDAAFMLKGLNKYFGCGCTENELKMMASILGSDCAFFIENTVALGTGRGEILTPVKLSIGHYKLLLVNPGIHISSKEAYADVTLSKHKLPLKELIKLPVKEWRENIENDFENSVFLKHPRIEEVKDRMYEAGAVYSSMTGSGSAVFGMFHAIEKEKADYLFPDSYVLVTEIIRRKASYLGASL